MKYKDYIVTVSYGDYTIGVGGTDRAILAQQHVFADACVSVFHISPYIASHGINSSGSVWQTVEDGHKKRILTSTQVIGYLYHLSLMGYRLNGFIVHHLKNVVVSELRRILSCSDAPIAFYIHDYYFLCPYGGLVRNGVSYCGTEPPNPEKCDRCEQFKPDTIKRLSEIETLFNEFAGRIQFVAPSETAAAVWSTRYVAFKSKVKCIPHQICEGKYTGNMRTVGQNQRLKVAFVGYGRDLKGYSQWLEAVKAAHEDGCPYDFYQFGWTNEHLSFIKEIDVDFKSSLTAMTDALRDSQIDCAVLWSLCPETYSYTYYEAFAANCYILTNCKSGNIAEQVRHNHNGYVADSEDALKDILINERELRDAIQGFKASGINGPGSLTENPQIALLFGRTAFSVENPSGFQISSQMNRMICLFHKGLKDIRDQLRSFL